MRPYVSFIVCTRNDAYAGGLAKCQWGVRYLAEQCEQFGLDAELILVEWNPPADRPPLAHEFRSLASRGRLGVRVITVPPTVHLRYLHSDRRPMHAAVAANVGLRRARGEFCVFKVADTYYPDSVIQRLAQRRLRSDRLYRLERWDVAASVGESLGKPRSAFLAMCAQAVAARHSHLLQPWMPFRLPDLFGNASGDFQLLAAPAWHELRGYLETQDVTSFEVDSLLSYAACAQGIVEERLMPEGVIFKISHGASHNYRLGEEMTWLSSTLIRAETALARIPFRRHREFWLRALFNYPAKTYSGLRKPVYERSLVRFKLIAMLPWLTRLKSKNWGLANESLEETLICRALWEQG